MTNSKNRLLDATIDLMRSNGFTATRVEDIAAKASVTKGSFFHHFRTKEDCAAAAAERWSEQAEAAFAASGYRDAPTPAARVLAYLDFRIQVLDGPVAGYCCYAGTVLQEVHETQPQLAAACAASMLGHARTLEGDLAGALGPDAAEAPELAVHIQAVIQGALLIAKAESGNSGARSSLLHLRRYIESRIIRN
jgi:TetR/AcrR family transcriptional repressor of nem operon